MSEIPGKIRIGESEKHFGLIAIEKGYITPHDLIEALKEQVEEDLGKGSHRLIGEILAGQGKMTDEQVEDVLTALSEQK
ncbi:MAG: hypothetical protein DRG87_12485 [Deltaproteobacteria bacterium]|nr:hypothetical protein [Deltaproteobacteria bacterium]MBW2078417.1 hypothetical protein [Deltaproteobacteria bacterium]MBW2311920.1 hypothetical protein [Deltaproteobacteria bacterium]RLB26820.1 MAG: hypothetical protein DRG87_12485 [Deltaproteobacteria bacterium]